jgi:hypothetical protein
MDYQKIYDNLMLKARSENRMKGRGVYYEAHHIVPKCMGGQGKYTQWRNHPNIILLTYREHILSHKLLCLIYPENGKLWYALQCVTTLSNSKTERLIKLTLREREEIRVNYVKYLSEIKSGENNPLFGTKRPEHSEKMKGENNPMKREENKTLFRGKKRPEHSEKMKGDNNHMKTPEMRMWMSQNNPSKKPEVATKISNSLKGKSKSEDHKEKLRGPKSEGHKEKLRGPKPKISCPHCGKLGAPSPMKRFHFDNCKHKVFINDEKYYYQYP